MHAGSSKSNHACMDKYVKYSQPASCWTTVFLLFSCGSHSGCLLDLVWGLAEACCCTALNIAVRQLLWQCVALGHVNSPRRVACNFLSSEMAFLWHTSCKTAPHLQYRLRSEIAQTDKTMLGHLSNLSTCYTKAIECDCTALRRKVAPKQDVSVLANLQWQRAWYNELGNYIRVKRANNATLPPLPFTLASSVQPSGHSRGLLMGLTEGSRCDLFPGRSCAHYIKYCRSHVSLFRGPT